MFLHKKRIILFGGFHDNNQTFIYHNDIWVFSMEKYTWTKVETEGIGPTPRSGEYFLLTKFEKYLTSFNLFQALELAQ